MFRRVLCSAALLNSLSNLVLARAFVRVFGIGIGLNGLISVADRTRLFGCEHLPCSATLLSCFSGCPRLQNLFVNLLVRLFLRLLVSILAISFPITRYCRQRIFFTRLLADSLDTLH